MGLDIGGLIGGAVTTAANSFTGGLASMGLNALGGLFGGSKDDATERAYAEQRAAQERDFAFQREMWDKEVQQWERTNKYNSPANQARLLSEGGYSPAALMGGNFGSSASQINQPSSPSHGVTPIMSQAESNPYLGFSSISQAMQSLSNVPKNLAEIPVFDAKIKEMLSRAGLNDASASLQKLYGTFEKQFGADLRKSKIAEQVGNYFRSLSEAYLASEQGDTEKSKRLLNKAIAERESSTKDLNDAQRNILEIDARYEEATIRAKIGLFGAQSEEARASAKRNRAESEQIEFWNSLRSRSDVKYQLIKELRMGAQQAESNNRLTKAQVEQVEYACKQLEKATDNYEIQMWSNIINQTINTAANAAGEFTKYGLAKKFLDSKPSQIESGKTFYLDENGLLFKKPY